MKIFRISRGTKRRSLSLVKLKTSPAFLKMNSTTNIYSKFSKISRATISRGRFCLNISQEITVYWCDWFYFPVRPIWHSKECFSAKFLVKRGTRTPCTACQKKRRHYFIVHIASVRYVQAEDCNIIYNIYRYMHTYIHIYIYNIYIIHIHIYIQVWKCIDI